MDKMNQQSSVFLPTYKKVLNVAISKALMTILNIFGFGAYFTGLYLAWINVDVFTRSVMQVFGCVFLLFKIIQSIDTFMHKRAMNKLERRKQDLEQTIREETYIRGHD